MAEHMTIDTAMAKRMVKASVISGASIIGQPGGWGVVLKLGLIEKRLGSQRIDKPRLWRSLDRCIEYLKGELNITRVDLLDASAHEVNNRSKTRHDTSARMRQAHEAAAYDKWFREQVQASIDDPSPAIPDEEVKQHFAAKRDALRKSLAAD